MKHILRYAVVVTFFSFAPNISALENIKVGDYELVPYFSDYITKYNVFVSPTEESVNISALLSEEDDYVTGIGNISIIDGKNEVTLKVVKKNMEIDTYEINIFKNYKENLDYENATLSKLEIEGVDINFNPNTYEYEINIEQQERLNINYVQTSEFSTVKISGNSNFKIGENIIKIAVTSKDKNTTNIYVIKANKIISVFEEKSSEVEEINILGKETLTKKETNIITISIISICFILIVFAFYLLFVIKKKR